MLAVQSEVSPIILCIDDDDTDLDLLDEAFQISGAPYTLHRVMDGEEGLRFLRQQEEYKGAPRPDLVLLDLNMPRMNGHEVLRIVKADPDLRRIPILVLTTSDDPTEVRACYDGGANSYITKPDDFGSLIEVARSIRAFWFEAAALCHA